MWNGWCIGWSGSISLTSRIFTRSPTRERHVDRSFSAPVVRSMSFQRMLRRGRDPVDLDHVVFPLDPAAALMAVAVRRRLVAAAVVVAVGWSCRDRAASWLGRRHVG